VDAVAADIERANLTRFIAQVRALGEGAESIVDFQRCTTGRSGIPSCSGLKCVASQESSPALGSGDRL
jgi:hypothetical protein